MKAGQYPQRNLREVEKMTEKLCLRDAALAMSYVPWQQWEDLYEECEALERGTAFPSLYLPFYGKGAHEQ